MKAWKERRDSIKPDDLHFRPECDEYKCGAHTSWSEGYGKGYEEALKDMGPVIETLEYIASDLCVEDNRDGHKVAREAIALFEKLKAETKE
jgi:hypothetical protein